MFDTVEPLHTGHLGGQKSGLSGEALEGGRGVI